MESQSWARQALIDDLLESDVGYFEAGATITRLKGATIARMGGFQPLAAGCVVQRIDPDNVPRNVDGWLEDIEQKLSAWGQAHVRLYLQRPAPNLEAALALRGYQSRDELAVMRTAAPARRPGAEVTFRPIENDQDWDEKLALHRQINVGPDGHPAPCDLWVRMEHRKCEAGYMKPYLVLADGKVAGAVNVAPWKGVLRLKNVVIAPQYRRHGLGTTTVAMAASLAAEAGKVSAGAFVVAGAQFLTMYTNAGFEVVSRQTEWVKELSTSQDRASRGDTHERRAR